MVKQATTFAAAALTLVLVATAPAQQVCIDFDSLPCATAVTNQFPEATFSTIAGQENRTACDFVFPSSAPNYLCTADISGGLTCTSPTYIDFTQPITNLTFLAMGDDNAGVTALCDVHENGTYSATVNVITDGNFSTAELVDLTGFSNVTRIEIHGIVNGGGLAWDDFCFERVTECFLVIGNGPGASSFVGASHLFDTQVGPTIEDVYPVLLTDIPEFVLPTPAGIVGPGFLASGLGHGVPTASAPPAWMQDGEFVVQVLMWNPQVFPGMPEQYTAGLYVKVRWDGSVLTSPYGAGLGGLQIWHEMGTNAAGQKVIRFPFSIPGF